MFIFIVTHSSVQSLPNILILTKNCSQLHSCLFNWKKFLPNFHRPPSAGVQITEFLSVGWCTSFCANPLSNYLPVGMEKRAWLSRTLETVTIIPHFIQQVSCIFQFAFTSILSRKFLRHILILYSMREQRPHTFAMSLSTVVYEYSCPRGVSRRLSHKLDSRIVSMYEPQRQSGVPIIETCIAVHAVTRLTSRLQQDIWIFEWVGLLWMGLM